MVGLEAVFFFCAVRGLGSTQRRYGRRWRPEVVSVDGGWLGELKGGRHWGRGGRVRELGTREGDGLGLVIWGRN